MHAHKNCPCSHSGSSRGEVWAWSRLCSLSLSVGQRVCACVWPNARVCVRNIAQLTQRHSFLYDSQLCGLGSLFGDPAARNVWCATPLESPSYTRTHTHSQPTPDSTYCSEQGRRRDGPQPRGRMVQIPQLIEKHRGVGLSGGTDVSSIRPPPPTHTHPHIHHLCSAHTHTLQGKWIERNTKNEKYSVLVGIGGGADSWMVVWLSSEIATVLPDFGLCVLQHVQ